MSVGLAIFAKTPGLSPVKTRLAASIGDEKACEFYQYSVAAGGGRGGATGRARRAARAASGPSRRRSRRSRARRSTSPRGRR